MSSPSTTLHAKQGRRRAACARTILAGSVGNAVEWFDWTIYASFAIFSSQFFPEGNETTRCWPRSASSRSASSCARWAAGCWAFSPTATPRWA